MSGEELERLLGRLEAEADRALATLEADPFLERLLRAEEIECEAKLFRRIIENSPRIRIIRREDGKKAALVTAPRSFEGVAVHLAPGLAERVEEGREYVVTKYDVHYSPSLRKHRFIEAIEIMPLPEALRRLEELHDEAERIRREAVLGFFRGHPFGEALLRAASIAREAVGKDEPPSKWVPRVYDAAGRALAEYMPLPRPLTILYNMLARRYVMYRGPGDPPITKMTICEEYIVVNHWPISPCLVILPVAFKPPVPPEAALSSAERLAEKLDDLYRFRGVYPSEEAAPEDAEFYTYFVLLRPRFAASPADVMRINARIARYVKSAMYYIDGIEIKKYNRAAALEYLRKRAPRSAPSFCRRLMALLGL